MDIFRIDRDDISINPKPTIYRNLCKNTGSEAHPTKNPKTKIILTFSFFCIRKVRIYPNFSNANERKLR